MNIFYQIVTRQISFLSERLEDNRVAAEWGRKQAELIKKSEEITKRLTDKYTPIILARKAQREKR